MYSTQKMQNIIGVALSIGALLSALLVIIGGTAYLIQNGHKNLGTEFFQIHNITTLSIREIWSLAFSFTPLGLIELGLLLLVATQTIRVALLCGFYALIRDYVFLSMSLFILIVLIYSSFWRT